MQPEAKFVALTSGDAADQALANDLNAVVEDSVRSLGDIGIALPSLGDPDNDDSDSYRERMAARAHPILPDPITDQPQLGPVRAGSPGGGAGGTGAKASAGSLEAQQKQRLLDRIEHDFTYHAPAGPEDVDAYQRIRNVGKAFAMVLVEEVPTGRELSSAIAYVDKAVMHANAGRARGGS